MSKTNYPLQRLRLPRPTRRCLAMFFIPTLFTRSGNAIRVSFQFLNVKTTFNKFAEEQFESSASVSPVASSTLSSLSASLAESASDDEQGDDQSVEHPIDEQGEDQRDDQSEDQRDDAQSKDQSNQREKQEEIESIDDDEYFGIVQPANDDGNVYQYDNDDQPELQQEQQDEHSDALVAPKSIDVAMSANEATKTAQSQPAAQYIREVYDNAFDAGATVLSVDLLGTIVFLANIARNVTRNRIMSIAGNGSGISWYAFLHYFMVRGAVNDNSPVGRYGEGRMFIETAGKYSIMVSVWFNEETGQRECLIVMRVNQCDSTEEAAAFLAQSRERGTGKREPSEHLKSFYAHFPMSVLESGNIGSLRNDPAEWSALCFMLSVFWEANNFKNVERVDPRNDGGFLGKYDDSLNEKSTFIAKEVATEIVTKNAQNETMLAFLRKAFYPYLYDKRFRTGTRWIIAHLYTAPICVLRPDDRRDPVNAMIVNENSIQNIGSNVDSDDEDADGDDDQYNDVNDVNDKIAPKKKVIADLFWPHKTTKNHFSGRRDKIDSGLALTQIWEKMYAMAHKLSGRKSLAPRDYDKAFHNKKVVVGEKRSIMRMMATQMTFDSLCDVVIHGESTMLFKDGKPTVTKEQQLQMMPGSLKPYNITGLFVTRHNKVERKKEDKVAAIDNDQLMVEIAWQKRWHYFAKLREPVETGVTIYNWCRGICFNTFSGALEKNLAGSVNSRPSDFEKGRWLVIKVYFKPAVGQDLSAKYTNLNKIFVGNRARNDIVHAVGAEVLTNIIVEKIEEYHKDFSCKQKNNIIEQYIIYQAELDAKKAAEKAAVAAAKAAEKAASARQTQKQRLDLDDEGQPIVAAKAKKSSEKKRKSAPKAVTSSGRPSYAVETISSKELMESATEARKRRRGETDSDDRQITHQKSGKDTRSMRCKTCNGKYEVNRNNFSDFIGVVKVNAVLKYFCENCEEYLVDIDDEKRQLARQARIESERNIKMLQAAIKYEKLRAQEAKRIEKLKLKI